MKRVKEMTLQQAERLMVIIRDNPRRSSEQELTEIVANILEQIYDTGVLQGKLNGFEIIQRHIAEESKLPQQLIDTYDSWYEKEEPARKGENENVGL